MSPQNQFYLNFHGIGAPHDDVDASERPYWIDEGFYAEILDLVLARPDAERIQFTFDDGNTSDLTVGAPALARRGRTAQFFLLTGRFGRPHYLSHDDVQTLVGMGMQIGLHGHDHVDWRRVDGEQLSVETIKARDALAAVSGAPVESVAIPFGAYNRGVITHLKRSGYRRIYTSDGGPVRADQQVRSRTSVRGDMTLEQISALIDGRIPFRSKARRIASIFARRHLV